MRVEGGVGAHAFDVAAHGGGDDGLPFGAKSVDAAGVRVGLGEALPGELGHGGDVFQFSHGSA